jgi:Flp pilus assembly protein TadB
MREVVGRGLNKRGGEMNRNATWWLMVALVLVFDVVTVVFHLLAPPWQGALLVASGVFIAAFLMIRALDWRMRREHRRLAYAALGRAPAA